MEVLKGYRPESVWHYFKELSSIPRGSYHEKAASDYCVAFAKEHGLQVWQDAAFNVVIVKEASAGYEEADPVILQGHLDMVCEKTKDCNIDFEKDGLTLAVEGDFVYAEGTTLGGDDGIAVAYALAVLADDKIEHPRLEVIFTSAEEVGMDGAWALDTSMLKGHTMINLDSEGEGVLLAGCAGGCHMQVDLALQREQKEGWSVEITVGGLLGGHSGAEIHKRRGNANVLLGEVLAELEKQVPFSLLSAEGGLKDNAITRESKAMILLPEEALLEAVQKTIMQCQERFAKRFHETDPGVQVQMTEGKQMSAAAMTEKSKSQVIRLLNRLPYGVIRMNPDIPEQVQTSLNLGILSETDGTLHFQYAVRSSVGEEKEALIQEICRIAEEEGASTERNGEYPAWEYRRDSALRTKMQQIYEQMFGKKPTVEVIHAGLECGILSSKIPGLDCVSIGPNLYDIHTTEERMSISSVERTWNYLLEVLRIK